MSSYVIFATKTKIDWKRTGNIIHGPTKSFNGPTNLWSGLDLENKYSRSMLLFSKYATDRPGISAPCEWIGPVKRRHEILVKLNKIVEIKKASQNQLYRT